MRFNVLHLIADDLRTSIGAYGHTDAAKTPHLDRLAAQGVVFENAYSQIAVCTPSRNSFMTGRNPDTTGVYNDAIGYPDFRASPRGHHWTTLPGHFAKHGYFVTGLGKTYRRRRGRQRRRRLACRSTCRPRSCDRAIRCSPQAPR